jgi:putative transposase
MKKTVSPVAEAPAWEEELPVRVQEALGELAAAAREGLLALSVGVGLGVLAELMEEEVIGVVGLARPGAGRGAPRTRGGRSNARRAPCCGRAPSNPVSRRQQRVLACDLNRQFADRDPLTRVVLERMLAGVSTRRCRRACSAPARP